MYGLTLGSSPWISMVDTHSTGEVGFQRNSDLVFTSSLLWDAAIHMLLVTRMYNIHKSGFNQLTFIKWTSDYKTVLGKKSATKILVNNKANICTQKEKGRTQESLFEVRRRRDFVKTNIWKCFYNYVLLFSKGMCTHAPKSTYMDTHTCTCTHTYIRQTQNLRNIILLTALKCHSNYNFNGFWASLLSI